MKVSELTDDELNRLLHEKVMGECWHETEPFGTVQSGGYECRKCSKVFPTHCPPEFSKDEIDGHPNYCQDLNAAAKAEIESGKAMQLYNTLLMLCEYAEADVAFAPARKRAEAIAITEGLEDERTRSRKAQPT